MTKQTRDILIKGASLLGGEPTDIALSNGVIVAIGVGTADTVHDPRVIDADGLIALPGLVDIHTHLRQPGGEDAETVFTGTRAAAVGGYTAVHAMANTTPTQDTAAIVDQVDRWLAHARKCASFPMTANASQTPSSCVVPSNTSRDSAASSPNTARILT